MRTIPTMLRVCVALTVAVGAAPAPADAQYTAVEPMSCPSGLLDYPVAKAAPSGRSYVFISDWRHASNPGSGVTQAFYNPDGWLSNWIAVTLKSTDGRAKWQYAGIYVGCRKIVHYRSNGTIERVQPIYTTLRTEGEVEEDFDCGSTSGSSGLGCCGGGSGGGGAGPGTSSELTPVTSESYNPYDASGSAGGGNGGDCEGSGDGETGETGGTQYEPGDNTGGETVEWGTGIGNGGTSACGDTAIVEYICIDVWVDGVGWVEWSCGYATTC